MSTKRKIMIGFLSIIGLLVIGIAVIVVFRPFRGNQAYRYNENEGIFVFYRTDNEELYRELLPEEFDMPDELIVHLFVMDFYDIDSDAEPYKEMSISLLAKYNGVDIWHCIYMPVTSEQSMIAGIEGLGLPKTMGDIQFIRNESSYVGTILDNQSRSGTITIDTSDYVLTSTDKETIRGFMDIPKMNILNGDIIEMSTSSGSVNIIDVVEDYPDYIYLLGGNASIVFDDSDDTTAHPFDLEPTEIIAAYFLHNEIPFSLGRN